MTNYTITNLSDWPAILHNLLEIADGVLFINTDLYKITCVISKCRLFNLISPYDIEYINSIIADLYSKILIERMQW